jgi:hypothetical protein
MELRSDSTSQIDGKFRSRYALLNKAAFTINGKPGPIINLKRELSECSLTTVGARRAL